MSTRQPNRRQWLGSAAAGREVLLLEARERPGGRCLNQALPKTACTPCARNSG